MKGSDRLESPRAYGRPVLKPARESGRLTRRTSMDPLSTAEIGTTGLRVTRLGLGGGPLSVHREVPEEADAVATIRRAYELGVRYFDTAPLYGYGNNEHRFGAALRGLPSDQFVLSTKVGRLIEPIERTPDPQMPVGYRSFDAVFDFSRDGILRSLEDSLLRLNLDRVDIALIHDPENHYEQAIGEAFPALAELRSQGVVRAVGAGMNQWQVPAQLAREGDFDCFLLAGRYTLLDQSALDELLPLCLEKGISIILGGPYNGGVLASDLAPGKTYLYATPQGGNTTMPQDMLDRARRIKAVCDRHDVPLRAATLQFGLAHPAVAATIPGAKSVDELEDNLRLAGLPVPSDLWSELRQEGLLPRAAPVPIGGAKRVG